MRSQEKGRKRYTLALQVSLLAVQGCYKRPMRCKTFSHGSLNACSHNSEKLRRLQVISAELLPNSQ